MTETYSYYPPISDMIILVMLSSLVILPWLPFLWQAYQFYKIPENIDKNEHIPYSRAQILNIGTGRIMSMQITFTGESNKTTRKVARASIKFYAAEILSPRILKNLDIEVKFLSTMYRGYYGLCDSEEFNRPRSFRLSIAKDLSRRMTLITLAHEMWHVKQYATEELKDYLRMPNKRRWRGKTIPISRDYIRGGFEWEASKMEIPLYKKFMKEVGI